MTDAPAESTNTATGRPPYSRTQSIGLGVLAGSLIVQLVAGLVTGLELGEVVAFLVLPAVLLLVGMALTMAFGTWAKVVGIVLALAAGAMLFFFAFGILTPASFVDFISGVMFVVGFLMALVGGITAIVKRHGVGPTRVERQVNLAGFALVALAVIVSVPLWLMGRQTVSEAEAADATPVVAHDFEFSPGDLDVSSGTTLLLKNDDAFLHTFTVDELGIDIELLPGDRVLVPIEGSAGSYVFYCRPHSSSDDPDPDSDDMAGTIVVH